MLMRVFRFVGRRLRRRHEQRSDEQPVVNVSVKEKLDAHLDLALNDTFPSSDPVSLTQPSTESEEFAIPEQDPRHA